jgi:leucyl-tRNA synthetase
MAEELWQVMGGTTSVFDAGWPAFDPALIVEDRVTMAVQINGKTRGTITVSKTATQDEAMAAIMADPALAKFITGTPKRVIFVPGRLINVIV